MEPRHTGAQTLMTHCRMPSWAQPPPVTYVPLPGSSYHTNAIWDLSCHHRSPQQPQSLDIMPGRGPCVSLGSPWRLLATAGRPSPQLGFVLVK